MYLFYKHIKKERKLHIVLQEIYGLNISRIKFIIRVLNVYMTIKLEDMSEEKCDILYCIGKEMFNVERRLKRENLRNVVEKVKGASYIGLRLRQGLPTRGQRTRTNAGTPKRRKGFWEDNKGI